jgi:hypothetical protein
MSLLRLLTSGKSLVGVQVTGGRYSPARQGTLPKFHTKANPFRATTRPTEATAPCLEDRVLNAEGEGAAAVGHGVSKDATPGVPAAEVAVPKPEAAASVSAQQAAKNAPKVAGRFATARAGAAGWFGQKWATLTGWVKPSRAGAARAAGPVPQLKKPLVQAELSLEGVKVVRNDLSDSDLEVVTTRPAKPEAPAVKAPTATPERAPAGSPWSRVAERMAGAGKT